MPSALHMIHPKTQAILIKTQRIFAKTQGFSSKTQGFSFKTQGFSSKTQGFSSKTQAFFSKLNFPANPLDVLADGWVKKNPWLCVLCPNSKYRIFPNKSPGFYLFFHNFFPYKPGLLLGRGCY